MRDVAQLLQVFKDRQNGPASEFNRSGNIFWQNARQIFRDAAAGDVRHARDQIRRRQLADDVQIAAVRLHQRDASFFFQFIHVVVSSVARGFKKQFSRQRVAIGVQAGRR